MLGVSSRVRASPLCNPCAQKRKSPAISVVSRPVREAGAHNGGRLSTQLAISTSIHATARGPSRRGAGKVFSCTMRQTVDRPGPNTSHHIGYSQHPGGSRWRHLCQMLRSRTQADDEFGHLALQQSESSDIRMQPRGDRGCFRVQVRHRRQDFSRFFLGGRAVLGDVARPWSAEPHGCCSRNTAVRPPAGSRKRIAAVGYGRHSLPACSRLDSTKDRLAHKLGGCYAQIHKSRDGIIHERRCPCRRMKR